MKNLRRILALVLALLIISTSLAATAFAADYPYTGDAYGVDFEDSDASSLKKGDVIALVGDSITHGSTKAGFTDTSWFVQFNYYLLTRFPELEIKTVNMGIGGINTQNAYNHQLENDYANHDFNKAIIYLGTNDGTKSYNSLNENKIKLLYGRLIDTFDDWGAETIALITPAGVDEDVRTSSHMNSSLKLVSDNIVKAIGEDRGIPVAYQFDEFQGTFPIALANKNIKMLQDGIHPSAAGSSVTFANLIEALNLPGEVATVVLNGDAVEKQSNCTVSDFTAEEGRYTYTYLAKALPFAQAGFVQDASEIMDYIEKFSRETLQVKDAADGEYQLIIDGYLVETFTAQQLREGINLSNYNTPMVTQSKKVAADVSAMTLKIRTVRDMELAKYQLRITGKADEDNMLEKMKEYADTTDSVATYCQSYLNNHAKMSLEDRWAELDTLWAAAYDQAQPEAHTVEIRSTSYVEPTEEPDDPTIEPDDPTVEPDVPTTPEEPKSNTGLYIGIAAAAVVVAVAVVVIIVIKKKK